jgi:hypothetical protein
MADSVQIVYRPIFLEDLGTNSTYAQVQATVMGLGLVPMTPIVAAPSDAAATTAGVPLGGIFMCVPGGMALNFLKSNAALVWNSPELWMLNQSSLSMAGGGSVTWVNTQAAEFIVVGDITYIHVAFTATLTAVAAVSNLIVSFPGTYGGTGGGNLAGSYIQAGANTEQWIYAFMNTDGVHFQVGGLSNGVQYIFTASGVFRNSQ